MGSKVLGSAEETVRVYSGNRIGGQRRTKDEGEDGLLLSEGEALEAMDVVELVQVSKSTGKSLGQGRKEQLGK